MPGVKTLLAHYLNVIDLLQSDNILIAQSAVDVIESNLGQHTAVDETVDETAVAADEEAV